MLMDISSEMIDSLLPFLVGTLGLGVLAAGIIEGLAEETALVSKVFSGALKVYLGKRKSLVLFAYAMGALTKPTFALATGVGAVVAAGFTDRVGAWCMMSLSHQRPTHHAVLAGCLAATLDATPVASALCTCLHAHHADPLWP